jgi:hypothetical protein
MDKNTIRRRRTPVAVLLAALAVSVSCSPGSLPGSPSRITSSGGGGRYDGTLTYRRLGGTVAIDESPRSLSMSIALGSVADQFTAQFQAGASRGTLQGNLSGTLINGDFRGTVLVAVPAQAGSSNCEGRGEASGRFAGANVTWTIDQITYTNCDLRTSSQAAATAVSPIPGAASVRANLVVTVFPGTSIARGTCAGGATGFPFVVELAETAGIALTLDDRVIIEERRSSGVFTHVDENPITSLAAGERRQTVVCGPEAGTYQAFFSGTDARGNAIRTASPVVTLGTFTATTVLAGTITNAANGQPIVGARVAIGTLATTSSAGGVYRLENAPSGVQTVQTSATGFNTRNDSVTLAAGSTTTFSPSLTAGGSTATLTGTISSAATAQPISGATVSVGGASATTNTSGVYTLNNAPTGQQTIQTAASGFSTRMDTVTVATSGTTSFSTSLVPAGAGGSITIVLNWGAQPSDLDAYLTGPNPAGGRFTVSFFSTRPVSFASLDIDRTTGFGPETISVAPNGASFVPGTYNYFVDNFSGTPGFDVSNATVSVFQGGAQLARFAASSASGSPAAPNWSVFSFTLTATPSGQIAITPVQQFTSSTPAAVRRIK